MMRELEIRKKEMNAKMEVEMKDKELALRREDVKEKELQLQLKLKLRLWNAYQQLRKKMHPLMLAVKSI